MVKTYDWGHLHILCLIVTLVSNLYGADLRKDLEEELIHHYQGERYMLRNFYAGDKLKYSADGILVSGGKPGIWPIDGLIELHEIKVKKDKIELNGKRLLWAYGQNKNEPVNYISESIKIEIGPYDSVPDFSSTNRVIHQIFLKSNEFPAAVPDYWKRYVQKTFVEGRVSERIAGGIETLTPDKITTNPALIYPQEDFQEPELLSQTTPHYTKHGREARISGIVILDIEISEEGIPTVKDIVKPLGLGLDESAVEAILKWRFLPAYYKGKPVRYPGLVEIRFEMSE